MLGGGRKGRGRASTASAIHAGLTGSRELIGTDYLANPDLRRQYHEEIAPRTTAAMNRILAETFDGIPGDVETTVKFRAADLACGTGAAGAALRAHFGAGLDVVSVDKFARGRGIVNLDVTRPDDLRQLGRGFNLVVAAHLLNELFLDDADEPARVARLASLVRLWCDALLAPLGTLVLIEPALRETSRALLQVRDRLLAAGLHVVAPCFCRTGCPALVHARDWCHDRTLSEEGRQVDFSYLVLRRESPASVGPELVRIVSEPLTEKGKLRLYACGAQGRHPVVRLDREASPANADFDLLSRGDIARIQLPTGEDAARHGDGIRIGADTEVQRMARRRSEVSGGDSDRDGPH